MIYQLHHQFRDGRTEMKSQADIDDEGTVRVRLMPEYVPTAQRDGGVHKWIERVNDQYPLPDGAQWLMASEESEYFQGVKE
jgi:hypothetical protein